MVPANLCAAAAPLPLHDPNSIASSSMLTSACTTSPVIAPPVSSAAMYRSPSANGVAGRTNKSTWVPPEPTFNVVWHRRQRQASPKDHQRLFLNHQVEALLEQMKFFIWHRKLISQDLKRPGRALGWAKWSKMR